MVKQERDLLIGVVAWRKTDYIQPHEYIVRKNHHELFAALAEALENDKEVYSEIFKGRTYKYLVIGKHKYWRIEDVIKPPGYTRYS